jgi:hypothetical protein
MELQQQQVTITDSQNCTGASSNLSVTSVGNLATETANTYEIIPLKIHVQ